MLTTIDLVNLFLLISGGSLASTNLISQTASPRLPRGIWGSATVLILILGGCYAITLALHQPVPRGHDEFSYVLLGDTLAHGRVTNPTPPLPEFFDTFHVLVRPVYVSKYFPGQGLFLAIGEKLFGYPAAGVWLSSALACVATYWMLAAWIGPNWGLFGTLLMAIQYGVFSYWSQSYWGGMVAALGGALAFGAARRLWDSFSWASSIWLALGIIIIVNSRPVEGVLALLPITILFAVRMFRERLWRRQGILTQFTLPIAGILVIGALLTSSYNRAITGSPWKPPYLLHEQQYQESPQFLFQSMRPKLTYSSPWVQYYYEAFEARLYQSARQPRFMSAAIARRLATWWAFFCGVLLTPALVLPGLLKKGLTRYIQALLLVGLSALWLASSPSSFFLRTVFDFLAFGQIVLLWFVFDGFWVRMALASTVLLLLESLSVKLLWPHYSAPVACLILYLQVEGLRRAWHWHPPENNTGLKRTERRRLAKEKRIKPRPFPKLRAFVYLLPFLCLISLAVRVEARIHGWNEDPHGPDRQAHLMDDWSLRRADLEHWLEEQPGSQLVFVWYSAHHRVTNEWVYNHADLVHSKVIWARDLGAGHNRLLLQQFPERTAWLVDADRREPQLIPYAEVDAQTPAITSKADTVVEQEQLGW